MGLQEKAGDRSEWKNYHPAHQLDGSGDDRLDNSRLDVAKSWSAHLTALNKSGRSKSKKRMENNYDKQRHYGYVSGLYGWRRVRIDCFGYDLPNVG